MKKQLVALVSISVLAGAVFLPSSASATTAGAGAALGGCRVQLPTWPSPPPGSPVVCGDSGPGIDLPTDGLAVGVGAFYDGASAHLFRATTLRGDVDTYSEECVLGEPPLVGEATGTLHVGGVEIPSNAPVDVAADFDWQRIGLVAVIVTGPPSINGGPNEAIGAGAGVAAFVPEIPLPTCTAPGPLTAHVIGLAGVAGLTP